MNNDGVTSTATTSNPNSEILDNHQSSTTNMQAMSVISSLPSSNTVAITTSTNMISSGVATNGVANSVSSASSMSLQQSSISESEQMGMRGTVAGGSAAGVCVCVCVCVCISKLHKVSQIFLNDGKIAG